MEKTGKNLTKNTNDEQSFHKAVVWIGKISSVIRSVKSEELPNFTHYLYLKKDEIEKGTTSLDKIPKFGNKSPKSWVSKVCHIMNPKGYPIIFDKNVNKIAKDSGISNFKQALEYYKNKAKKLKIEEIYQIDSELWAKSIKE